MIGRVLDSRGLQGHRSGLKFHIPPLSHEAAPVTLRDRMAGNLAQ
jgi:hypothetical protein